jgi:hypothetical protein
VRDVVVRLGRCGGDGLRFLRGGDGEREQVVDEVVVFPECGYVVRIDAHQVWAMSMNWA